MRGRVVDQGWWEREYSTLGCMREDRKSTWHLSRIMKENLAIDISDQRR